MCLLAACESTATTREPVGLELSQVSLALDSSTYVSGGRQYVTYFCSLILEAHATGPDGGTLEWESGAPYTRNLDGVSRGTIHPPGTWNAAQLVEIWGSSRLAVDETVRSRTIQLYPYPYSIVFRYRDVDTGERFAHPGMNTHCITPPSR